MWNKLVTKFKELIEWDTYNSISTYFLYFLDTYGNELKYRNKINTCELINKAIMSFVMFILTWMVAFIVSYIVLNYFEFIAVALTVGFENAMLIEEIVICFLGINIVGVGIGGSIGLVKFIEYRKERRYAKYEEMLNAKQNGTYVEAEKGIIAQWYEAFNNKFCKEIELNKFRPKSKQRVGLDDEYEGD